MIAINFDIDNQYQIFNLNCNNLKGTSNIIILIFMLEMEVLPELRICFI